MKLALVGTGMLFIALGGVWLWKLISEKDTEKRALNKKKIGYALLVLISGVVIIVASFSPLSNLFLIGAVLIAIGGWLIQKILRSEKHPKGKRKEMAAICGLAPMVGAILLLASFAPLAAETTTETVIADIAFRGIGEDTAPLAATNLKLVKTERKQGSEVEACTYTVIATLTKNSGEPAESYFDFTIALVDENGAYIKEENTSTMPTPFLGRENGNIFTYGGTSHFEQKIYGSPSDKTPVAVEFIEIKELSKTEFVYNTLNRARDNIDKQYYGDAGRCADMVLKYEPDNEEAKALLLDATTKEKEQIALEAEPVETEPQIDTPAPVPTDDSASDEVKSKYLEDVKRWAEWLPFYTEDLFSSLAEADFDNEIWHGQIEFDIVTIRDNIDLLKSIETPEGLEEIQQNIVSTTDSYYLVTEDVESGVKNMDGEECAKNLEAANQNYDSLVAAIEKYSADQPS